jgi:hypothetical protein
MPGICYELLRGRTQLPREESTFVHVSRVLLVGTFITAITILLLALTTWISPRNALLNIPDFLIGGGSYIAHHLPAVGWTIFGQLFVSVLLAVALSDLSTPQSAQRIHQADAWHALGDLKPTAEQQVYVSVQLKSGRTVNGYYSGASTDLDPTKRELLLRAPLSARGGEGEATTSLDSGWHRMAIAGAEIESVAFSYIEVGELSEAPPPTPEPKAWSWLRSKVLSWQVTLVTALSLLIVITVV